MTKIESLSLSLWKEEGKLTGEAEIVDDIGGHTILSLDIRTACLIVAALHCFIESQTEINSPQHYG